MVYNYTKPRGPIAAMYSSPGPCYGLPSLVGQQGHDPRSSHNRGPSYAFGTRHGNLTDDCSPGPCYNPDSKTNRNGKDGTPHYSLYARPKDQPGFKTPGPGAYAPESTGPTAKRMPPAYSFGSRHHDRSQDNTPGPNSYSTPGMLGKTIQSNKKQSPAYTLSGRSKIGSFHEDLQKTPGPGAYTVIDPNRYKKTSPQYSMTGRNVMPSDATRKPGPGAHSPERNQTLPRNSSKTVENVKYGCKQVWTHKREPPHFSFGIRHSQYSSPLIVEAKD